MIEMVVDSIRVSLVNYQRVVVLKEKDSERYLPIWIGASEADAIAIRLQNIAVARPLTHDLLKSMIEHLGGKVQRILVTDLADDVFYARIVLAFGERLEEIDSRPSDAIALAVRTSAPIFVADGVLEKAGVSPEAETEDEHAEEGLSTVKEEEVKKLAAFRDFIDTLDLDNLGRGREPDKGDKA
jgi:uncharacterized protein